MYNDLNMTEKLRDMLSGKELKYDPENRFLIKLGDEYFGAITYVALLGPEKEPVGLTMLSSINGNLNHITAINVPHIIIDPETTLVPETFKQFIIEKSIKNEDIVTDPKIFNTPFGYN